MAVPSGTGHHEIVVQTTDPQVIAPLDAEPQVIILNKMNPLLIISANPQVVELNATDPPVIAQADPKINLNFDKLVFLTYWRPMALKCELLLSCQHVVCSCLRKSNLHAYFTKRTKELKTNK